MQILAAASTTVISAGPNFACTAGRHRVAGRIQAKAKHHEANDNLSNIDERESDVFAAAEPRAPVHHKPHVAGNDESEPRAEEGADEAEQITENGYGLGYDPGERPGGNADADPGPCSDETAAV